MPADPVMEHCDVKMGWVVSQEGPLGQLASHSCLAFVTVVVRPKLWSFMFY